MRHIIIVIWFGLWMMYLNTGQTAEMIRREKRSVVSASLKTWPGAIVPYVIGIGTNKTEEDTWWFSDLDKKLILKAMQTIEQESCVRFIDASRNATLLNQSYIEIVGRNEKYCHAQLGVANDGKHELILNPLCRSFGQILHELAHVLGLMHELMRPDRDEHIIVHEQNILPDYTGEFRRLPIHQAEMWNRDFDFQSVTLYDPFTFSTNSKPVWEPRKPLDDTPLFSLLEKDLSFEDAAAINLLYKCGTHCPKHRSSCRPDEYLTKACRCETRESYAFRRCKDDRRYRAYCSQAIEQNKCYDETRVAVPFCRKTCGRCFRSGIFGRITPPKKICNDLDPNKCPNYVSEGYCYFDAWTRLNCQKACGLCPPPRIAKRQVHNLDARSYLAAYQEGKCLNRFDDLKCQVFADNGDCKKNPSFMSSYCALACDMCANKSIADLRYLKLNTAPCRNYIDDDRCDALAREGKCRGVTLKQCLASCNKCGDTYWEKRAESVTLAPQPSKTCRDQWELCPHFVQLGDCEHKRELMERVCPKSCKFCQERCEDFDSPEVCSDVVRRGYCSKLGQRCAKSCGLCTTTADRVTGWSGTRRIGRVDQRKRKNESKFKRVASKILRKLSILSATRRQEGNNQFAISFQSPRTFPTIVIKDPPCHDARPAKICRSWARSGYCAYSHVSSICKATCTACQTA